MLEGAGETHSHFPTRHSSPPFKQFPLSFSNGVQTNKATSHPHLRLTFHLRAHPERSPRPRDPHQPSRLAGLAPSPRALAGFTPPTAPTWQPLSHLTGSSLFGRTRPLSQLPYSKMAAAHSTHPRGRTSLTRRPPRSCSQPPSSGLHLPASRLADGNPAPPEPRLPLVTVGCPSERRGPAPPAPGGIFHSGGGLGGGGRGEGDEGEAAGKGWGLAGASGRAGVPGLCPEEARLRRPAGQERRTGFGERSDSPCLWLRCPGSSCLAAGALDEAAPRAPAAECPPRSPSARKRQPLLARVSTPGAVLLGRAPPHLCEAARPLGRDGATGKRKTSRGIEPLRTGPRVVGACAH